MKPVESGCAREGDALIPADGNFLKEASGVDEPIENITPVRFEEPLAPWVAAERQGTHIDLQVIGEKFKELSERYDALVVEGIGGLMVPIKRDYFVSDIAADLALPMVIVASAQLGTINHTLLTVEHALRNGLEVAGLVFNHPVKPEGTIAEETNPDSIAKLTPVPIIGVMPFVEGRAISDIEMAALESFDMDILRKYL
jgi:dethiobiotin synthetase